MTWPCFYCTYDNEDDSATQCCLCGMPGNRIKQKTASKSNNSSNGDKILVDLSAKTKAAGTTGGEGRIGDETNSGKASFYSVSASALTLSSTAIDLTSPDKSVNAFSSKRKRNNSPVGTNAKNNNEDGTNADGSSSSSQEKLHRNFYPGLARRKPPQRPKINQKQPQNQKQSTLSFSMPTSLSHFPHGHVFGRRALPLDDPIRRNYQAQMKTVLKKVFGMESLRKNLQPAAIQCAMEGKSQMIVMATGGGKSLCYQLPACLLGGVTIVISPLLALMKDQTEALHSKGIPANCINSSQTEKQNKAILEKLVPALYPVSSKAKSVETKPSPPAVLLYVTPESIQTERMRAVLKTLYKEDRLSMFAVDEAHCLSTWVSK